MDERTTLLFYNFHIQNLCIVFSSWDKQKKLFFSTEKQEKIFTWNFIWDSHIFQLSFVFVPIDRIYIAIVFWIFKIKDVHAAIDQSDKNLQNKQIQFFCVHYFDDGFDVYYHTRWFFEWKLVSKCIKAAITDNSQCKLQLVTK